MTEAEIAELKRLKDAATLGPYWSADGRGLEAPAGCIDFAVCRRGTRREVARVWTEADTHYITALLTQADALLAAAEAEQALRTENERLREALSQIKGGSFDEAVRFALDGKWQEFAIKLQGIARAALGAPK